jgi:4-hydroxy-tetrahydrodipicolinate synthase
MLPLIGTGVAVITPFTEAGVVDFKALDKIIEHLIYNKVEYLVVLGTTGETATLDTNEKALIFDAFRKSSAGRLPLVAGIGGNNTAAVVETLKQFDFSGYEAVLSVCPYYNKPNQSGIIKHYIALANASPKPIILYNVPGRTGVNMTAATTLTLAQHPNIKAMKEASGNFEQIMEIIANKPEHFMLISGDDALTLPMLSIGAQGVISVIANAYPRQFSELVRMALNGNYKAARDYHYQLLPLMQAIFADGSPGGIKETMKHLNLCETHVRLPLEHVNETVKAQLLKLANNL